MALGSPEALGEASLSLSPAPGDWAAADVGAGARSALKNLWDSGNKKALPDGWEFAET